MISEIVARKNCAGLSITIRSFPSPPWDERKDWQVGPAVLRRIVDKISVQNVRIRQLACQSQGPVCPQRLPLLSLRRMTALRPLLPKNRRALFPRPTTRWEQPDGGVVWWFYVRCVLADTLVDDVVGKGGPVVLRRGEALSTGREVFCFAPAQPTIVFGDGSPLLEGLDVRDDVALGSEGHSAPSGRRIPSMMARFCASLMPPE
jgi:hypothetical protein